MQIAFTSLIQSAFKHTHRSPGFPRTRRELLSLASRYGSDVSLCTREPENQNLVKHIGKMEQYNILGNNYFQPGRNIFHLEPGTSHPDVHTDIRETETTP